MLASLRASLERVRKERNWQKGERVRLIFHAFKPLRDNEARVVTRLAEKLSDFQLEFAFLHVASDTNLQLFDRNAHGILVGQSGKVKGVFVPERGLMLALSDRDMLVGATGAKELKRPTDGAPVPLRLHLHPTSTFRDLRCLGQQVMLFASHSWRGFQPASMPVKRSALGASGGRPRSHCGPAGGERPETALAASAASLSASPSTTRPRRLR